MPASTIHARRESGEATAADGWTLRRIAGPSGLHGANGLAADGQGQLFVAQGYGGRVSQLDPRSGSARTVVEAGTMTAPDDLAFDSAGAMYVTDTMPGQVWRRSPEGAIDQVVSAPGANGITCREDRIFVDECTPSGRVLEVFPDGRAPRVLAEGLVTPNALAVGPDDHLYIPLVGPGEIVRVPLDGGTPEPAIGGLPAPTAVKFDADGHLMAALAGSGELVRFDRASGSRATLVRTRRGIDNFAFVDEAVVLSNFIDGGVLRLDGDGTSLDVVAPGLIWPLGLTWAHGKLWLADGLSLVAVAADGSLERARTWLDPDFPALVRGLAPGPGGGLYVTSSAGELAWLHPGTGEAQFLTRDRAELMDVAVAADGSILAVEAGGSRVLRISADGRVTVVASGLAMPAGIVVDARGTAYVSERGSGRVVRIERDGDVYAVATGLAEPHGLTWHGADLAVLDVGRREVVRIAHEDGARLVVASGLPVGPPPGVSPLPLTGLAGMVPGPLPPFTGLATGPDGDILVAASGDGSVVSIGRSASTTSDHERREIP